VPAVHRPGAGGYAPRGPGGILLAHQRRSPVPAGWPTGPCAGWAAPHTGCRAGPAARLGP